MKTFELAEDEFLQLNESGVGFCVKCGEEAYGCEPDLCEGFCESCDQAGVYGVEELLIMGLVTIKEDEDEEEA